MAQVRRSTQLGITQTEGKLKHARDHRRREVNTLRSATHRRLPQRDRPPNLLHHVPQRGLLMLQVAMDAVDGREIRLQRLRPHAISAHHVRHQTRP